MTKTDNTAGGLAYQQQGEEPTATVATPYGEVTGPLGAIQYLAELIADDTNQPVQSRRTVAVRLNTQVEPPPGMKLVPIEPNEAMLVNGREALMPIVSLSNYGPLIGMWRDMLAHAPGEPAHWSRGPKYEAACRLAAEVREVLAGGPGEIGPALPQALKNWEDTPLMETSVA